MLVVDERRRSTPAAQSPVLSPASLPSLAVVARSDASRWGGLLAAVGAACHPLRLLMANDDDDFATLFEQSMASGAASASPARSEPLKAGQVVKGIVVAIGDDTIFVDVGTKAEARLDRSAVTDREGNLKVAVGDEIKATVAHPGGRQPPRLVLSYGAGGLDTEALELAAQSGTPIEGEITRAVKAGLEVVVGGVRAFCPASQVDLAYVADLETFVGQRHFFRVLEVRDGGRSVVVSRKALMLAEREEKAAELAVRLEEGAELDGIVQSIQPYGAFVDLGGLQGLVHVSQMAHSRVGSPSDVVSVGESVRVKVTSIQSAASGKPQDMRISLSMKALVQPTAGDGPSAAPAEVITATVSKVESFGVLVDTPAGAGLVPNGELALPPGSDPRRAFSAGDTLDVVLQRREPSGRLRFSARAVEEAEARSNYQQFRQGHGSSGKLGNLGDLGSLLAGVDLPDAPASASAPAPAPAPAASRPAPAGTGSGSPAPTAESAGDASAPRKGRRRRV